MKFRSFVHKYHDSHLVGVTLGPRRELMLEIDLDPVWNSGGPGSVCVRFGNIQNYEEVAAFFGSVPQLQPPRTYIAQVIGLEYLTREAGADWLLLDLDEYGCVNIHSRNITEL